jgi:hypothetical protein
VAKSATETRTRKRKSSAQQSTTEGLPADSPAEVAPSPEPAAVAPPPPPAKRGKPAKPPHKPFTRHEVPKNITFFDRIRAIDRADWGTRAKVRTYRLEPVIDRIRSGDPKYIQIYEEPVSEEKLKADHGSGRYRLYLNYKAAGETGDKELDSTEVEIFDPKFPPKIEKGQWLDDSRNEKWAWAKSHYDLQQPAAAAPAAPAPAADPLAAFEVFNKIEDRVMERNKLQQPPPAPAIDPMQQLTSVMGVVQTILSSKADNPMVDVMRDELKAMRDEIRAERDENRKLQAEIRNGGSNGAAKSDPITLIKTTVDAIAESVPKLKGIFPGLGDTLDGATKGRSRMTGWQEMFSSVAPDVIEFLKPFGVAMASNLMGRAAQAPPAGMRPPGAPGVPPAGQIPGAPPPNANAAGRPGPIDFLRENLQPMLNYFDEWQKTGAPEWSGDSFAESIHNLWGDNWRGLDWRTAGRTAGVDIIVAAFEASPAWRGIAAAGVDKFRQFVADFLAFDPDIDGEPAGVSDNVTIDQWPGEAAAAAM